MILIPNHFTVQTIITINVTRKESEMAAILIRPNILLCRNSLAWVNLEFSWRVLIQSNTYSTSWEAVEGSSTEGISGKQMLNLEKIAPNWNPVHNMSEEFDLFAFFLRLGLPFTPNRHENRGFLKRSSNRRNLKTMALRFSVDEKHFRNEVFQKRWHH